jgi:riboflavin kinase/FMN adenylyltransferase
VQRWRGLAAIPAGWGRCVVTIGVFDGVHRGHQAILSRAGDVARALDLPSVLVTFTPHPSEVLRPGSHPPLLTTNTRKAELAGQFGVDVVLFLPFTLDFARLAPADFVHQALVEKLHAAAVVIGENFRFGHRAAGDLALLADLGQRWGFDAIGASLLTEPPLTESLLTEPPLAEHRRADQQLPISSTFVRSSVLAGDVTAAAAALGRPHRLDGVVVRGDQRGGPMGYPTANVRAEPFAAVPADGVYAGRVVRIDERGNTRTDIAPAVAAISVGTNPTFDGQHRSVEAFILDFDEDLYGQNLGVEFWHRLRGMERYDGVEALMAQMALDVTQTRALMS